MIAKRFCLECRCTGEPEDIGGGQVYVEKNWHCPLLGGNLCEICCQTELRAGKGFPDTLGAVSRKTGKTATEIHAICMECPYGGSSLDKPFVVIEVP